jgi:hypothetical protein
VEETELVVIPTASKAKISHDLSYPIGAEAISKALKDLPQFSSIRLQFYYWSDCFLRRGKYEYLRVEYLNNVSPLDEHPVSRLFQRPPQYQWEIVIQPVPRIHRHQVKTYIAGSVLTEVREWLKQRSNFTQNGSEVLAFFYDEKLDKFETYRVARLEPAR